MVPTGSFSVIQLIPEIAPERLKFGYLRTS